MKRFLYFLSDRLQITYYERLSVLTLGGIFILLLTINQLYRPAPAFSEEYYTEIIADFNDRVQARDAAQQELMARYFPDTATGLIAAGTPETTAPEAQTLPASPAAGETAQPQAALSVDAQPGSSGNQPAHAAAVLSQNPESLSQPLAVSSQEALSPDRKININTADADELVKLPGIGPAIAARIIEYRTENGPFSDISEIKNVRGIGQARFEAIKDYITTERDS